jgi:chaperonin GroEL (HSP60 family)
VVQDELGVTLEKATEDVLGTAAKITVGKESCVIVGSGQYEAEIQARVAQIKTLCAATEQDYEREKLNERIARLSGGVAVIQVRSRHAAAATLAAALTTSWMVRMRALGRERCVLLHACMHAPGCCSV